MPAPRRFSVTASVTITSRRAPRSWTRADRGPAGGEALPRASLSLAQYIAGAEEAPLPEVEISPDDIAVIAYTSGTTGKPKGAVSTHAAVCQAIMCFECSGIATAMANPELFGAMMQKGFEPTSLLAVPLFHVSGCYAVFLTSLRGGRRIVIMYKWDVEPALRLIQEERVTVLTGAPSMLMELLESPLFEQYDTSSLFNIGAGGAATPAKIGLLMHQRVHNACPGTGCGHDRDPTPLAVPSRATPFTSTLAAPASCSRSSS